ncbi:MAG: zf-HC2 domain-containing protein [Actinomycetota bacterium]|nr:zf-HC2 domain-containing protein [Actinomycetota bacterium]
MSWFRLPRLRRQGGAMDECREVMRVLQAYLDGEVDEETARMVAPHLDACRRCGLEAHVYEDIKAALASRAPRVDQATLDRLERFGEAVATGEVA